MILTSNIAAFTGDYLAPIQFAFSEISSQSVLFTFFIVLFFVMGTWLIYKGFMEDNWFKIVIGFFLSLVLWGIIVYLICYLTLQKQKVLYQQQRKKKLLEIAKMQAIYKEIKTHSKPQVHDSNDK